MKTMKKSGLVAGAMLAMAMGTQALAQAMPPNSVTTSRYDDGSTVQNIDESCRNVGFDQGEIVAICNYSSGTEVHTRETSIEADDGILCVPREGTWGYEIAFATGESPDGVTLTSEEVDLTSNGQIYQFKAICHDSEAGLRTGLRMHNGLKNVNGNLTWGAAAGA